LNWVCRGTACVCVRTASRLVCARRCAASTSPTGCRLRMAGRSGRPQFTVRLDCWIFLN